MTQPFLHDVNLLVDLLQKFTDTYRSYPDDTAMREARCLSVQWRGMVQDIQEHDLFAGRLRQIPIGFSPQSDEAQFGYYIHFQALQKLYADPELLPEQRKTLDNLVEFWSCENSVAKTKKAFTPEMRAALPSDRYFNDSGIAFPLWRMAGMQLNYKKLMRVGIPGLRHEIKNYRKMAGDPEAIKFYDASLQALDTFCDVGLFYAQRAEQRAETASPARQQDLQEMARILRALPERNPQTFREGLQLLFLYNILDGARNYGRLDDALAELYVHDIENGSINREEAIRLLTSIWRLMRFRDYKYDTRVIIGGKGRDFPEAADQLALDILETSRRVKEIVPQLALHIHQEQNPELYNKALDLIGEGYPFPILYNDDVNIPAVQQAFDLPYDAAKHYVEFGCGEYVIDFKSTGSPNGVINLLQALLVTLHNGIDPVTGKPMGLPQHRLRQYGNFETFAALLNAYKEQVEYHVEQLAQHEALEYKIAGQSAAFLFSSMLTENCLPRGKGLFCGGVRYLGGTLESYGNTNVADSLVALKQLVYEQKQFTLDQVVSMLDVDFQGYEKQRQKLLECPKFGNDNDIADSMRVEIDRHVCETAQRQKEFTPLDSYLVVIINNDANTVMGEHTPASPDGRRAYDFMANANSPMNGLDQSGLTALLNSLVKPDISLHAGATQNLKFSKEMFSRYRDKLEILLATYFEKGAQAMLNVVDRGELEAAIKHPERYQNLIVRVGGFSERFVNLPPHTQQEILSRTLY